MVSPVVPAHRNELWLLRRSSIACSAGSGTTDDDVNLFDTNASDVAYASSFHVSFLLEIVLVTDKAFSEQTAEDSPTLSWRLWS